MPRCAATWSSCASTAWPTSTWRRRSTAGARPPSSPAAPTWEGGRFDGSEEERRAHSRSRRSTRGARVRRSSNGAPASPRSRHREDPERIVVSSHDFEACRPISEPRARAMRRPAPARSRSPSPPRVSARRCRLMTIATEGDAVVIGMGEAGVPSRLLAARFGSRWTYAGNGVAPGQIPATRMIDDYGFARVGPATRALRRRQHQRDALAVAGDAQRGVRGGRARRGLRSAAGARLRRLPGVCRRDGRRGRERHDSVQARCAAAAASQPTR